MERAFAQHHGARAPRRRLVIAPPSPGTSRPAAYCIVAQGIDADATGRLRAELKREGIELVVEHRAAGRRRSGAGRRRPRTGRRSQPEPDRRRILHADGRRVAERRIVDEPGPVALLPPEMAASIDCSRLRFVTHSQLDPEDTRDIEAARLVIRYQAGDHETTVAQLCRDYNDDVYRFAFAAVRDGFEAEDICRQVFLNVAAGLSAFDLRTGTFRSWLFRMARHRVVDRLRCGEGFELLDRGAIAMLADAARRAGFSGASDWVSRSEISDAVDDLPRSEREVIVLRHVFGCTHQESSELLGRSEASVRMSHHLAMSAIQAALDERSVAVKAWRRTDQPMRALFLPRQLAISGFSQLRHQ